jgi:type VI secretion system protein ImpA
MTTTEQLLAPISEAQPCGEDIAFSTEMDAIARARQADDPSIDQGAWITSLKEADWKFVHASCAQLIETRSKDLKLAVWMAEAGAHTNAFRGLGDGMRLLAALCERYWDELYPLPDESGFEQRIGNLCWIAAHAPQLIRDMPLTEGEGYCLNDFDAARTQPDAPDFDAARRATSPAFHAALLADAEWCLGAVGELERTVDERLGADGPSFLAARTALEAVIHSVTPWVREMDAPAVQHLHLPEGTAPASQIGPGPIQNRSQALAQLREVAEFFRRTEPHSPVAYLADRAASWGEQPLHVWLRSVVKDQATMAQLQEMLGLETDA